MKLTSLVPIAGAMLVVSVALSFIHPWGDLRSPASANAPLLKGSDVPAGVRKIVENSCMDCHSSNTSTGRCYSRLAPGSWLLEHDAARRPHASQPVAMAAIRYGKPDRSLQQNRIGGEERRDACKAISAPASQGKTLIFRAGIALQLGEDLERKRVKQQLKRCKGTAKMQEKPADSGQGKDASHSNDQSTEN